MCKVLKLKIQILDQKSKKLYVRTTDNNEPHQSTKTFLHIDNVVNNQLSLTFKIKTDELLLLNKGLKFALPPVKPPIEELVTATRFN